MEAFANPVKENEKAAQKTRRAGQGAWEEFLAAARRAAEAGVENQAGQARGKEK